MTKVFFDEVSGGAVSSAQDAFSVTNTGSGPALRSESASGFTAIYGTGKQNGLFGQTSSPNDSGVHGHNDGSGSGVAGFSKDGFGIVGRNETGFAAVHGHGGKNGVWGFSTSPNDSGVYGQNDGKGNGVAGFSKGGIGVRADTPEGFAAVFATSNRNGVVGESNSPSENESGVAGINRGNGFGVRGVNQGNSGTGVRGHSAGAVNGLGVTGTSINGSGVAGESFNPTYPSILGRHDGQQGRGVVGYSRGLNGTGIVGISDDGEFAIGVAGFSKTGLAGYFQGNVQVNNDLTVQGTLTAARKLFRIDHPLDPANKYLFHAAVESPEMVNVYGGNVTTDNSGEATVDLPDYFEALNQDFQYQLTVVGQFAQAIIAKEIQENRFTIKTDKPNVKVSWQVMGTRHDALASYHPMIVEQDKPHRERGLFLFPELHGQPEQKRVERFRSSDATTHLDDKIE